MIYSRTNDGDYQVRGLRCVSDHIVVKLDQEKIAIPILSVKITCGICGWERKGPSGKYSIRYNKTDQTFSLLALIIATCWMTANYMKNLAWFWWIWPTLIMIGSFSVVVLPAIRFEFNNNSFKIIQGGSKVIDEVRSNIIGCVLQDEKGGVISPQDIFHARKLIIFSVNNTYEMKLKKERITLELYAVVQIMHDAMIFIY